MESTTRRRLAPSTAACDLAAATLACALFLGACGGTPPPAAGVSPIDPALRSFLLDPAACDPADPALEVAAELHRRLIAGVDPSRIVDEARALAERSPDSQAARLIAGEALLVSGDARAAARDVGGATASGTACPALELLRGRALEAAGDPAGAWVAYGAAAPIALAATRRGEIATAARDGARAGFVDAMSKGHREAAAWFLELLEQSWPKSEAALRSRFELAAATGDGERELAAARALEQALGDADESLVRRRAWLELERGDARVGLALLERLAARPEAGEGAARDLERARFLWRLQNAPESVRRLVGKPELTRADEAVLVYWLVPRVRVARPGGARIASDVLDEPAREEIVKVVNLGLMAVDETLHRFSPSAPLRRGDALRIAMRLVGFLGGTGTCAAPDPRTPPCDQAGACGLIDDAAACVPGAALGGREAVEILRAALGQAGES